MQRRFKRPWDWLMIQASNISDLRQLSDNRSIDLALIGSDLPGGEIYEGLDLLLSRRPDLPCIAITDEASSDSPSATTRHPISWLSRPLPTDLPARIRSAIELRRPVPLRQFQREYESVTLHGAHPSIVETRTQIEALGPGWEPVQIVGEAGTGREHLARAIHAAGRRSQPFIYLYCGGWTEAGFRRLLTGSEDRPGVLHLARAGTLYLDRAGLLCEANRKAISTLMDTEHPIRLIASSTPGVDLSSVFGGGWTSLTLPPVRERGDDIEELVERILVSLQWELGEFNLRRVEAEAMDQIKRFPFSTDNLTELRRMLVWQALAHPQEEVLRAGDLPDWMRAWSRSQT